MSSSKPSVGLSSAEQSAWFYDFVKVQRLREGRPTQIWPVRVTGHAIKTDDSWRLDALHMSLSYPDADFYNLAAAGKLKPPDAARDDKGPGSEQLIGLTRRMLEDIAVKVDRTSDGDDVVLIGTDPGDVFDLSPLDPQGRSVHAILRAPLPTFLRAHPLPVTS